MDRVSGILAMSDPEFFVVPEKKSCCKKFTSQKSRRGKTGHLFSIDSGVECLPGIHLPRITIKDKSTHLKKNSSYHPCTRFCSYGPPCHNTKDDDVSSTGSFRMKMSSEYSYHGDITGFAQDGWNKIRLKCLQCQFTNDKGRAAVQPQKARQTPRT